MSNSKKYICTLLLAVIATSVGAQSNGCNSSYSRFGLGTLNDQSQGFNKAMGGTGIALRQGNRINMSNPASYSSIDSLSFLMDVGMSLSAGHLSSGTTRVNVKNCTLDYVNLGFRMAPGLGFSAGFVPFSTIGYNFSTENKVANDFTTSQPITTTSTYYGDGGLHQMYMGIGWNPFAGLSIGANASYIWGNYTHNLIQSFYEGGSSTNNYSGLNSTHLAQIKTYRLDFGAQYPIRINKKDYLILGATATLGHKVKNDATLTRYTSAGDSLEVVAKNAFDLPYAFGAGASWIHNSNLMVAADYKQERWADCRMPEMSTQSGTLTYLPTKGSYMNRHKVTLGSQYVIDPLDRHYINRIQWRLGANYATPYLVVNKHDGPSEFCLTAGAGLPISNNITKATMVNVSIQWMRRSPSVSNQITENYFMFSLGASINERWFEKFKIQ